MGVSDYAKRHMEAVKKYQMKCDSITIRPPKAIGQEIRSAAKRDGKSVQKYILEAVDAWMKKDTTYDPNF